MGAPVSGNLFEVDLLAATASDDRPSAGRPDVADPAHVLAEHRHQVPLPVDDDHHRQRDRPSGLSPGHL
jgi:hypothetical protein